MSTGKPGFTFAGGGEPSSTALIGEIQSAPLIVVWDPEIMDEADYARLIAALGDLVRSAGAAGVQRVGSQGHSVPADAEVLL